MKKRWKEQISSVRGGQAIDKETKQLLVDIGPPPSSGGQVLEDLRRE